MSSDSFSVSKSGLFGTPGRFLLENLFPLRTKTSAGAMGRTILVNLVSDNAIISLGSSFRFTAMAVPIIFRICRGSNKVASEWPFRFENRTLTTKY